MQGPDGACVHLQMGPTSDSNASHTRGFCKTAHFSIYTDCCFLPQVHSRLLQLSALSDKQASVTCGLGGRKAVHMVKVALPWPGLL